MEACREAEDGREREAEEGLEDLPAAADDGRSFDLPNPHPNVEFDPVCLASESRRSRLFSWCSCSRLAMTGFGWTGNPTF